MKIITLTLLAVLIFVTIGADKCNKPTNTGTPTPTPVSSPEASPTATQTPNKYVPYVRTALNVLSIVIPIAKSQGYDTSKYEIALKVGNQLLPALENNSPDMIERVSGFIEAFENVANDVELIPNPVTRTIILATLAAGNSALHSLADMLKKNEAIAMRPRARGATPSSNDAAIRSIVAFSGKKIWRCRDAKSGRFLEMSVCKERPDSTVVERVR